MEKIPVIIEALFTHGRNAAYRGYNKHDGLLSKVLSRMLGWSRFGRLAAIQLVMRSPVNIRPLLGVPKTINPKGVALFCWSMGIYGELTKNDTWRREAGRLGEWLAGNCQKTADGIGWGYQYPWQDAGFYAPANMPNRVVTAWAGIALHALWKVTGNPALVSTLQSVCNFLLNAPHRLIDTKEELCLCYIPDSAVEWAVMDVSALCGRVFAVTGSAAGREDLIDCARRCLNWVANRQTADGGWFYTEPPGASHITHDNYHTGIILDCFEEYRCVTGDSRFEQVYLRGLEFYRHRLFSSRGAPRWMHDRAFPRDIHGAAQGIITFSRAHHYGAHYTEQARKILEWTLHHLYNKKDGVFYYQKTRLFTKKFTLLRWCNAWMAVALVHFLEQECSRAKG